MSECRRDFLRYGALLAGGALASSVFPAKKVSAVNPLGAKLVVHGARWVLGNLARIRPGSRSWVTLGLLRKVTVTGLTVGSVVSVAPRIAEALQTLNIDLLLINGNDNEIILQADDTLSEERPLYLRLEKIDLVTGGASQTGLRHIGLRPGGKLEIPMTEWFPGFEVFDPGARQIFAGTLDNSIRIEPSPRYMVVDHNEVQVSEG